MKLIQKKVEKKFADNEVKEEKEEIKKFNEKEITNDKKENLFEQINISEEKRLNTDVYDNSKIIEKIMNNLEDKISEIEVLEK